MGKILHFNQKILLAASLIVLMAFSFLTFYNDYIQRAAMRENLEGYLSELGDSTSDNIKAQLDGRIRLVQNAAQNITAIPGSLNAGALLDQQALVSSFLNVYLGQVDGGFIVRPQVKLPEGYDPRVRAWYKDGMAAAGPILTEPYKLSTGELVISVVAKAGNNIGVVGADMALDGVSEIINSLSFAGMGYAFLVNEKGKILVHPDKKLVSQTLSDLFPNNSPSLSKDLSEVVVNGKAHLLNFTSVKGLPSVNWYIALCVDKEKAYSMLSKFRKSALIATLVSVVSIIILLGLLIRTLLQPLHAMTRAMEDIAKGEGDLTKRLTIHRQDEFGVLANAFNMFVERIHNSIREVSSATEQVTEVALRVVNASNSSVENSEEQSTRTNSVAAAINQLGATAQEIAHNAAQASNQASAARHLAEEGQQVVGHSIAAMQRLSDLIYTSSSHIEKLNSKTVNIGQILEVITSISQQTNLLALNAAIEAARAGEAGRGFAVVADEVRNLAHRTQESAQQVQQMIEELQVGARESVDTMGRSQRHSQESVEIANQAGDRLGSVTLRIGEIDGMNQSVATATEEQTAVVEAINVDINEINILNQEGIENLYSTLRACSELEQQASRLKHLVGSFRI
ncbi:methyl-accepting chemotaxis protein [Pseudomonas fulva]|uniref:methyl-accepting chemotaxis protein n=1 Tax=Pseudomonas fulva TaxID=47880 RepID=UPI003EE8A551